MTVTIEHLTGPTDAAAELIAELDRELGALYDPQQRHGYSIAQVFQPHVRFFIARLDGAAVGCGAVALFAAYAEVKRMYTRPAARGHGVGKALLRRIESEARAAGKPILRLETGTEQIAAMRLYEGFGFVACRAFGPYAEMEPHRIATSLFYEKLL